MKRGYDGEMARAMGRLCLVEPGLDTLLRRYSTSEFLRRAEPGLDTLLRRYSTRG